jgi:hypothetical protein
LGTPLTEPAEFTATAKGSPPVEHTEFTGRSTQGVDPRAQFSPSELHRRLDLPGVQV